MAATRSFPTSISTPTSSSRSPNALVHTCHLQGGADPLHWQTLGVAKVDVFRNYQAREAFAVGTGVKILKTCTPYLAGNVPALGEHCAWMESSAVIYANSVLGARTNTEGRESTSAAMLTGKIPDWGLHRDEPRRGTHRVDVRVPVESVIDWGMLGYFIGEVVQEHIPVLAGTCHGPDDRAPEALRRRGVVVGRRRDVSHRRHHAGGESDVEMAFGGNRPLEGFEYGAAEQRRVYDRAQRQRQRPERGLRDAGMSARGARATRGSRDAARREAGSARNCTPLDLHVARGATARRDSVGIREGDQRCRRRGDDRYLLGVCAGDAAGDQGGGARLGEAGALPAGDPGRPGVVRHDARLHQAAVTGRWNGERP